MSLKELREKTDDTIGHELQDKQKHLFDLRSQAVTEKLEDGLPRVDEPVAENFYIVLLRAEDAELRDQINAAFRKAKPGDMIQLYATGLALTPAGVLPTLQLVSGVTVTIGTTTVPASFAGFITLSLAAVVFIS